MRGWDLLVPRATSQQLPRFPFVVPLIYGKANRERVLTREAIAIPIHSVFSKRTGELLVTSRSELCSKLLIDPDSKLILSAVHHDQTIEDYWSLGRAKNIAKSIAALKLDLVTTPNFSLFANVQRWDNFHNMKRIAVCWYELAAEGNTTALHINARTPKDYQRWGDFLIDHPEISSIAFEFQTGAVSPARGEWHAKHLCGLAWRVSRPLQMVALGGLNQLSKLKKCFRQLVFVTATPSMKSSHHQEMVWKSGIKHHPWSVRSEMAGDALLNHNIQIYDAYVNSMFAAA